MSLNITTALHSQAQHMTDEGARLARSAEMLAAEGRDEASEHHAEAASIVLAAAAELHRAAREAVARREARS